MIKMNLPTEEVARYWTQVALSQQEALDLALEDPTREMDAGDPA